MSIGFTNEGAGGEGAFQRPEPGWYLVGRPTPLPAKETGEVWRQRDDGTFYMVLRAPVSDLWRDAPEGCSPGSEESVGRDVAIFIEHPTKSILYTTGADGKKRPVFPRNIASLNTWLARWGASPAGLPVGDDEALVEGITKLFASGPEKVPVCIYEGGYTSFVQHPPSTPFLVVFERFAYHDPLTGRPGWKLTPAKREDGTEYMRALAPVLYRIVSPGPFQNTLLEYPWLNITLKRTGPESLDGGGTNANFPKLCELWNAPLEEIIPANEELVLERIAEVSDGQPVNLLDIVERMAREAVENPNPMKSNVLFVKTTAKGYLDGKTLGRASALMLSQYGGEGFTIKPLRVLADVPDVPVGDEPGTKAEPVVTEKAETAPEFVSKADYAAMLNARAEELGLPPVAEFSGGKYVFAEHGVPFAKQYLLAAYEVLGMDRKDAFRATPQQEVTISVLLTDERYQNLCEAQGEVAKKTDEIEKLVRAIYADVVGSVEEAVDGF